MDLPIPPRRRRGRPPGAQSRVLREPVRALGRHHFAFLRALLDGIDIEDAWTRYLSFFGGPTDRRHFASRLRHTVAALERGCAEAGLAKEARVAVGTLRLLPDFKRRPRARDGAGKAGQFTALPAATPAATPLPSFDAWKAERCASGGVDEDFFPQGEWLELYKEEFGPAMDDAALESGEEAGPMRARDPPALAAIVHARQDEAEAQEPKRPLRQSERKAAVAALVEIEQRVARLPQLDDPVGRWLSSGLPTKLGRVGVLTLRDLVAYTNLYGFRWHRRVSGLGAVRAQRLTQWLAPVAEGAGVPLAEVTRRPETDVVALRKLDRRAPGERFALAPLVDGTLPDSLSGRRGEYRSKESNIWAAETDVQAIGEWLSRFQGLTRRDYTRIAERFYLWCIRVRRKALSSLVEADIKDYQAFVAAPPVEWVEERKVRREDARWRPFRGALGRNTQRREFAVVASLFAALMDKGYLRANVMAGLGKTLDLVKPSIDVRRSLDERQWAFATQVLHEKPDTPQRRRLQLVLELGSTTGLRLSELTTTRMRGFRRDVVDGEAAWLLDVVGKGGKQRTVVVFDEVKELIEHHHRDMQAAGLGLNPEVARVQIAESRPKAAAAARVDAQARAQFASSERNDQAAADVLAQALRTEMEAEWEPLIGIIRRPPPRRRLDSLGIPFKDSASAQADRFGALEPSALYQSLRRFFKEVAREAAAREDAPPAGDFLRVSTHWLRHTFANAAIKEMQPQVLQSLLGHSDLRVTSVYVQAEAADLVRGMRAVKRRRDSGQRA